MENDSGKSIDNKTFFEFHRELFDLWYNDISMNRISDLQSLVDISNYFEGTRPSLCSYNGKCLNDIITVSKEGDVLPCGQFYGSDFTFGNIREISSIDNIFSSENYLELVKQKNYS